MAIEIVNCELKPSEYCMFCDHDGDTKNIFVIQLIKFTKRDLWLCREHLAELAEKAQEALSDG